MSILENLPHLATAKRRKRTKDSIGGGSDSLVTVFSDRACWLQQAGSNEIAEFKKDGISISGKVFFLTDPSLDENHVLVISGNTYDVKSFAEPDASAGLGILFRVMVNRKTTAA